MTTRALLKKITDHRRPIATTLAVIWAVMIFSASSIPGEYIPSRWSSFGHFCEYWVLAVLLIGALHDEKRRPWKTALIALVITSLYAATDEFHQVFTTGRVCDHIDWLTDTAGATLGGLAGTWGLQVMEVFGTSKKSPSDTD